MAHSTQKLTQYIKYGEVLSTRLLWALGFGADRMYPVRVVCKGCPDSIKAGRVLPSGERVFDPAVIERKARGWEVETQKNQGWSWRELDLVDADRGGAPQAHRDALKLLAVIIHHSDSKPAQQRLMCLDPEGPPEKDGPNAKLAVETMASPPSLIMTMAKLETPRWAEVIKRSGARIE